MQEQLQQLLLRPESETLDFKSKAYDLSTEWGRFALVKDVVCMANTPRDHASYIILGVECPPFGKASRHNKIVIIRILCYSQAPWKTY